MGQVSSIPSDHWRTRLVFTSHSLSDNVATCPDLGLIYSISTPRSLILATGPTSISRRDSNTQEDNLIAGVEGHSFSQDRVRIAPRGGGLKSNGNGNRLDGVPFVKERDFLIVNGSWTSTKRTFRASNGQFYVWKRHDGSLQLFTEEDKYTPIAEFSSSKGLFDSSPMHIKLAQGSEQIVDEILVTGVMMEKVKRRRDSPPPV